MDPVEKLPYARRDLRWGAGWHHDTVNRCGFCLMWKSPWHYNARVDIVSCETCVEGRR